MATNLTPTTRSNAQPMVKHENQNPSKRIRNQGMTYNSQLIPSFEL